jgi:hypothetical protein
MRTKPIVLAFLAGLGILAAVAWGVLAYRGNGPWVVRGIALGVGLGAAGSLLEAWLVTDALRRPRGQALGIVLAGFGFRLFLLLSVSLVLAATKFADPAAFCLCFLGGFLGSLPVLAAVVSSGSVRNGGAHS